MTDHLIAPQEPDALISGAGARRPPVVLDALAPRRSRRSPLYLDGHVPGAVYVALDRELAAHGDPTEGRHPLPSAAVRGIRAALGSTTATMSWSTTTTRAGPPRARGGCSRMPGSPRACSTAARRVAPRGFRSRPARSSPRRAA
jgi:hypothetical protein